MPNIPFTTPDITQSECDAVLAVMRSGWLTTGAITAQFEQALTTFAGADGTVCVSSATTGLEAALRLCGVGAGDEVIVPAYTFSATAAAVVHVGATPVLADCAPGSFLLSADTVARHLTPRTAAVIPVDIGGTLCDYSAIKAACGSVCRPYSGGLIPLSRPVVIADAAHSLGSSCSLGNSGALADFSVFSFHATKNLTTAEGGALLWKFPGADSAAIYRALNHSILHGQSKSAWQRNHGATTYDIVDFGHKANLSDLQSAIGLSQLKRYPDMLARRKAVCETYDRLLPEDWSALHHGDHSSYHLYLALLPEQKANQRNFLLNALREDGICCNLHFPPLPMLSAYKKLGLKTEDFPNAMALFARELSLPLSSLMTCQQAEAVCAQIKVYLEG
ncbi:DegT/DnrJ/EryC1/StrS family aminotransferase [Oscillospiraceae bacterium LTW-04]|nr:DegT/DnrJ/EryC1/StrS family aminotransferase [Oscillospiraceae bacterium MB24-C1]